MPLGPIQILVIGFDQPEFKGEILAELERLRNNDVVRLVDAIVVRKDDRGSIEKLQITDLTTEEAEEFGSKAGALVGFGFGGDEQSVEAGAALGATAGEDGHILDEDIWYVDDAIPNGTAAAIALIEHRWAIPLREAINAAGGFHRADAWIHPADLIAVGLLARQEAAVH